MAITITIAAYMVIGFLCTVLAYMQKTVSDFAPYGTLFLWPIQVFSIIVELIVEAVKILACILRGAKW